MLWKRVPARSEPSFAGMGRCEIDVGTTDAAVVGVSAAAAALPSKRFRAAAAAFAAVGDSAASALLLPSAGAEPTAWRSSPSIKVEMREKNRPRDLALSKLG